MQVPPLVQRLMARARPFAVPILLVLAVGVGAHDFLTHTPAPAVQSASESLTAAQAIAIVQRNLSQDADCRKLTQAQNVWKAQYQGQGVWLVSITDSLFLPGKPASWHVYESDQSYDAVNGFTC